ncbi:MAG TPA: YoaK family protein [Pseudolabrys sp.]|nr:YoaK family protein [Pseudolabrys sp.]
MHKPQGSAAVAALLSFNGGFVDTAGFLGLAGLFTAHVTGNFVTLGAALVLGTHGIIGKILALPEFILVIALARVAGAALRARDLPALRVLLIGKVALLVAFVALAVGYGPFPDPDSPAALLTGFAGIAAMAVQNAVQRVHLSTLPPTTLMTGSTTQATLDAVDLLMGSDAAHSAQIRSRFGRLSLSIVYFAAGCAVAAVLYWLVGFWCLLLPVIVGILSTIIRTEAVPA